MFKPSVDFLALIILMKLAVVSGSLIFTNASNKIVHTCEYVMHLRSSGFDFFDILAARAISRVPLRKKNNDNLRSLGRIPMR